jgi:hypothetical protein
LTTEYNLVFIHRPTKSTVAAFGGMVLLKSFQRLGYFPLFDTLPPRQIHPLATAMASLGPSTPLSSVRE